MLFLATIGNVIFVHYILIFFFQNMLYWKKKKCWVWSFEYSYWQIIELLVVQTLINFFGQNFPRKVHIFIVTKKKNNFSIIC